MICLTQSPRNTKARDICAGLVLALSTFCTLDAQDLSRRPLEHKDYDVWNTMSRSGISHDGHWAMYVVQNGAIDGEATLHIQDLTKAREYVVPRGANPQFTADSRFAIYIVNPEEAKIEETKSSEGSGDQLPQPQLQILELETGAIRSIDSVRSYAIPEESGQWLACLLSDTSNEERIESKQLGERETYEVTSEGLRRPVEPPKLKSRKQLAVERGERERPAPAAKVKPSEKTGEPEDDFAESKNKATGAPLVLMNLKTGIQRTFPAAVEYTFSKQGETLAFTSSLGPATEDHADKNDDETEISQPSSAHAKDGVHVIQLKSLKHKLICEGEGQYKNLSISHDGSRIAFISNKEDFESRHPAWSLYLWEPTNRQARVIASEATEGIPEGWWISPASNQTFSEDARRLYFDTAPIPAKVIEARMQPEATTDTASSEEEKAKLDIWHWQDPLLQPQQLLQAEFERKRDYRASYVFASQRIAQLATREIPNISIDPRSPSNLAVATTNLPYRKMLSWDIPGYLDTYLVNLNSGKPQPILSRVKWGASLSPKGKFIVWFDREKRQWFAKPTKDPARDPIEISKGIPFALQDELHDTPNLPRAYGAAGWLVNDEAFLVYDRYDIWSLDPEGENAPVCLTDGAGRQNDIRYRYRRLDREQRAIDPAQPVILEAFDRKTKASGYSVLRLSGKSGKENAHAGPATRQLESLIMLEENLANLQKAKNSDRVLFTRSTFRRCPDLWSSDLNFQEISRVSEMNPQQEEYAWGDAELVQWDSADGQPLDGILIKPDGFDPAQKYPLLVYFYERNSDNLHRYYPPAAGRSIICHSFYVSRGYLVFIPDIPYKTGEPGPSAARSVIPGVQHLIAQGFVDQDRIGMQGHSWGGYQTAFLVTQTDLFACAESGAPVSNMTSAYGGIRWGSGMSRMFQYERTQSRIGEDLWAAREKYVKNSPLFFANQINTPLLILHNDEDGAVPWYQGIELFVALRRLEKPAWLLNYNGNPHWVMGEANRRDFAIRMQQFFDHYLLDAPEPEWMAVGVRAVDKGKKFGLELLEPPAEQESEPTDQP